MSPDSPGRNCCPLELRKFVVPEFIFGTGAHRLAGQYARNFGARKALVVTDEGVTAAGWVAAVTETLTAAGLEYVLYDRVTPNPRSEEVMHGAELYRTEGCNIIVAVGGGSPIDCAKGIGIVSSNKRHILTFQGVDQVAVPMPPLICIPTTGGSSADVSQFAIITNEHESVKMAIISKAVVPDLALIDPVTLTTMSHYLTACCAFDALTHAIEAYVSLAHSPITDLHAMEAIRLITAHLLPTLEQPNDLELRGAIMLGSLYAGMAFSNASLGAVHAMAHSLGGLLDAAHGECNAILLEHVLAFNFAAVPERFANIARAMGLPVGSMDALPAQLIAELRRLRVAAGISTSLGDIGVPRDSIPLLAEKAMRDACMVTNPRRPEQRDIEKIYEDAFAR